MSISITSLFSLLQSLGQPGGFFVAVSSSVASLFKFAIALKSEEFTQW